MRHGGNVWQGNAPDEWLDYSANVRPDGPPEWVREAMRAGLSRARYYPDPAQRAARAALEAYLGVDEGWAIPTAGGVSAIDMAVQLPARGMRVFSPAFGEYAQQAAARGVDVREIPLLRGKHLLLEPAEALEGADIAGCALWLCNPMNPVGAGFDARQIDALLARMEAADGYLVIDEAFIHFCPEYGSIAKLRAHPRLAITGSMTKVLGIPGVRLGYLCGAPELLGALQKKQLCWELNCVAEAVLRALPAHAAEIEAEAAENARRREKLRAALTAVGAYVYPSSANFVLADFGRSVRPIASALRARGILVRECENFSGIDDGRHLRLAVKDEAANARLICEIREAMAICVESR